MLRVARCTVLSDTHYGTKVKTILTRARGTCATGCDRRKKSIITGGSASRQVDQFLSFFLLFHPPVDSGVSSPIVFGTMRTVPDGAY